MRSQVGAILSETGVLVCLECLGQRLGKALFQGDPYPGELRCSECFEDLAFLGDSSLSMNSVR